MLAACMLPGVAQVAAAAGDHEGVELQFSHYAEGNRDLYGSGSRLPNTLAPITVDGMQARARTRLTDRFTLNIGYQQDTWSGATPIGNAPVISVGNAGWYSPDMVFTGASPLASLPMYGELAVDRDGNFHQQSFDPDTGAPIIGAIDNRHSHVLTSASPETRRQFDLRLAHEWDAATVSVGGGVSRERDYVSRFANAGGTLDIAGRRGTLQWGLSHTSSTTEARLDPDALPYIATDAYNRTRCNFDGIIYPVEPYPGYPTTPAGYVDGNCVPDGFGDFARTEATLHGRRSDLGAELGLSWVLDRDSVVSGSLSWVRTRGYQGNPYKVVFGHEVVFTGDSDIGMTNLWGSTGSSALVEVRPARRVRLEGQVAYQRYLESLQAGARVEVRLGRDDWGMRSLAVEGRWMQALGPSWNLTPSLRYYAQSAADFYTNAVFSMRQMDYDADGNFLSSTTLRSFPDYYSSDHRLSAFGTLGAGMVLERSLAPGVSAELSFDQYWHRGGLKTGGGEAAFADYSYWFAGLGIRVDFAGLARPTRATGVSRGEYTPTHDHAGPAHAGHAVPAGVLFAHALRQRGQWMVGYRATRTAQGGAILNGSRTASVGEVRIDACGGSPCAVTPGSMAMDMHMLELMYAPSSNLTLMMMPQWANMQMDMVANPDVSMTGPHGTHGGGHRHESGGLGDLGLYALFTLAGRQESRWLLGLGGTIPTGDVDLRQRKVAMTPVYDQRLHYGMQLGSGTWDLQPSLTWLGDGASWSGGAQLAGIVRTGQRNSSGYVLGDAFQGSAWAARRLASWATATVRSTYLRQGRIRGAFPASTQIDPYTESPFVPVHVGPFDRPENYGGESVDVGLGLSLSGTGALRGNVLRLEWTLPVHEHVRGFQQRRQPGLALGWALLL